MKDEIKELLRLRGEATQGKWAVDKYTTGSILRGDKCVETFYDNDIDAEYIAYLHNNTPALIDRLEELEADKKMLLKCTEDLSYEKKILKDVRLNLMEENKQLKATIKELEVKLESLNKCYLATQDCLQISSGEIEQLQDKNKALKDTIKEFEDEDAKRNDGLRLEISELKATIKEQREALQGIKSYDAGGDKSALQCVVRMREIAQAVLNKHREKIDDK